MKNLVLVVVETFGFLEMLVFIQAASIISFFICCVLSGQSIFADIPTKLVANSPAKYQECVSSSYAGKFQCHRSFQNSVTTTIFLSKYTIDKGPIIHFCGDSVTSEIYHSLRCFYPMLNLRFHSIKRKKNGLSPARTFSTTVKPNLQYGDVVILNFGLWYNFPRDLKQYKNDLSELKSYLKYSMSNMPKIQYTWMHSSAQHFCTKDGTYHQITGKVGGKCCKSRNVSRLRKHLAEKILTSELGLEVFDLHRLTSERWLDHMGSGDCTHFCIDYGGPIHEVANKIFLDLAVLQ